MNRWTTRFARAGKGGSLGSKRVHRAGRRGGRVPPAWSAARALAAEEAGLGEQAAQRQRRRSPSPNGRAARAGSARASSAGRFVRHGGRLRSAMLDRQSTNSELVGEHQHLGELGQGRQRRRLGVAVAVQELGAEGQLAGVGAIGPGRGDRRWRTRSADRRTGSPRLARGPPPALWPAPGRTGCS